MAAINVDIQYIFLFFLLWFFSAYLLLPFFFKKPKKSQENVHLPPSPPSLPLIGHLHHLLSVPSHKSLQKLSSKHGPILHLRVFNFPMVLVSSAPGAFDVYRTQDVNFSSRFTYAVENSLVFGTYGFITAPYGDYWKFMKKLTMTELLGQQHLERSRDLRREELERFYVKMLDKAKRSEVVEVGKETMKLANSVICRMVMGRRFSEEDGEADQVRDLVTKMLDTAKKVIIGNAFRPLKKFGISLFEKEIMDLSRKFDVLLERILREHEENSNREHKDMVDLLLEAYNNDKSQYKITRNQMKSFVVDIFLGGTDSSARAVQWTMAELINNPNVLKKLREEIDSVVGRTRLLGENDLPNLPYLQAVVKEGLRLHPPGPVVARECLEGCKIGGFDIPKNTTVVMNLYAIMRDPKSWEDPDEFRPERFLVTTKPGPEENNKEQGMKYLPFGGGRRGCPGAHLAYNSTRTTIGIMVQCFDWKIEDENVNLKETGDLTLTMAHPLKCTPVLRFDPLAPSTQ